MKKIKVLVPAMFLLCLFGTGAFAAVTALDEQQTPAPTTVPTPVLTSSQIGIAFPNPAKVSGDITVSYPQKDGVTVRKAEVTLLSVNGSKVASVKDETDRNGFIKFGLSRFAPGIYFYTTTVTYSDGSKTTTKIKKIAIVR
jgi:hypothetical protein